MTRNHLGMYGVPRVGRLDLVQLWDGRWWASAGSFAELPVFRFRGAPSGLATRRQLRSAGLCPAGQQVAGWLAWGRHRRPRWAYLYRLDLARRKRTSSEAQRAALAKATEAARQRHYCRIEHQFGEWMACGCGQAIADHQHPALGADDWCEFEFRTCRFCPASQERHVTDVPTVPDIPAQVDVEDGVGVRRPGGPSAKTSHRAGWSPNHQSSSKEKPMVEPPRGEHEDLATGPRHGGGEFGGVDR